MTDTAPRPTSLIIVADDRLRKHLARALADHLQWCRRNAVAAPPELSALLASLSDSDADRGGQAWSNQRDDALLRDGLCVTYSAAAAALGVSVRTVRRLVASGRLRAVPVGGSRRILVDELRLMVGAVA